METQARRGYPGQLVTRDDRAGFHGVESAIQAPGDRHRITYPGQVGNDTVLPQNLDERVSRSVTAATQNEAPLIVVENWFEKLKVRLGN